MEVTGLWERGKVYRYSSRGAREARRSTLVYSSVCLSWGYVFPIPKIRESKRGITDGGVPRLRYPDIFNGYSIGSMRYADNTACPCTKATASNSGIPGSNKVRPIKVARRQRQSMLVIGSLLGDQADCLVLLTWVGGIDSSTPDPHRLTYGVVKHPRNN